MSIYRNPSNETQDRSAQISFVGLDERNNIVKDEGMFVAGTHCSYSLCGQIDYLPFSCDFCHNKFCSSHVKGQDHECPLFKEIEKDNTMPRCPVCSSYVKLKVGESPDFVVNRHINSGCVTGKLFDPEEKKRIKDSLRCSARSCMNHSRAKLSTLNCSRCKLQVCLSHRFYDDHECEKEIARQKEEESNNSYMKKVYNASSSLLDRLRGKKESQTEEEKQQLAMKKQLQKERALSGKRSSDLPPK